VHRKSRILQAVLGCSALRWVGLRSYGIYLWHWPVFMLTRPNLDTPLTGLLLLALRFSLTLILAELSFRLVETPVRSGVIERSWRNLQLAEGRQRRQLVIRWIGTATAILTVSVVLGSSVVRAQPPPPPGYLAAAPALAAPQTVALPFNEGGGRPPRPIAIEPPPTSHPSEAVTVAGLCKPTATPEPALSPTAEPTTGAGDATPAPTEIATPILDAPTRAASVEDDRPERVSDTRRATPVITTPTPTVSAPISATAPFTAPQATTVVSPTIGERITALGDSVMQGAAPALYQAFPGIEVDAEKGRQVYRPTIDFLIAQLKEGQASGRLGEIIVLHLGNNGVYPRESFDKILQTLSDRRLVIVLNVRVPRQWEDNNNKVITEGVKRYPNAVLIDWYTLTEKRPELFWNDGHHLRPEGALFYSELVAQAIKAHPGSEPPKQAE
jgi:hypothetical protein